jgi:carboxyl-terminal processing protease
MPAKRFLLPALAVAVLALLYQFAWNDDVWNQSLEKLNSMVSLIDENYYQDVDTQKLAFSSIRGMLLTLDPHSYFLDPENYPRLREDQVGLYSGIGTQIQKQEDRLVVISPIEGSPAFRLGIQAGDIISSIDGESTKPMTSFEAMQKLRGVKGTKVRVTIVREGLDKVIDLTITREEIPLYSVPYAFMLNDGIGYVFIRNFSETTPKELEDKLSMLRGQGLKGLILDLRLNGGGPLFPSVEVADDFLPPGALIVSMRGRNRNYNREFRAVRSGQYEGLPLVVLINAGSASASEIVAGAIMDNDRGYVVGEDSFGKGLVQTVYPLGTDVAVALTTAKYYTPSGRSIQRDYTNIDDYLLTREKTPAEREVRYTLKGRKVFGQGGITPDFVVRTTNRPLTIELFAKGTFFSYARKFVGHQTPLSKHFVLPGEAPDSAGPGAIILGQSIVVNDRIQDDYRDFLRTNKVTFDSKDFTEAASEIKRELERELASALWGLQEGQRVYRLSDPVVLKAAAVMPAAASLIVDVASH